MQIISEEATLALLGQESPPPDASDCVSSQGGYSWDQRFFQGQAALISQDTHAHFSSSRTPAAIGELVPELGWTSEFQGDTLSQHYFGNMMR